MPQLLAAMRSLPGSAVVLAEWFCSGRVGCTPRNGAGFFNCKLIQAYFSRQRCKHFFCIKTHSIPENDFSITDMADVFFKIAAQ